MMLCTVSSPPNIDTALADEEEKNGSSTAVNTGNSEYRQESSTSAADDIPVTVIVWFPRILFEM